MTGLAVVNDVPRAASAAEVPDIIGAAAAAVQRPVDKEGVHTDRMLARYKTAFAPVRATADSEWMQPPPAALGDVDARTAELAWRDVAAVLAGAVQGAEAAKGADDIEGPALPKRTSGDYELKDLATLTQSLGKFYVMTLNPESMLLGLRASQDRFMADMMKAGFDGIEALRRTQQAAMRDKLKAEEQATQEEKKVQQKAGKGQVAELVFNWVAAAAQVVVGAIKLATGQYASGAAELAAGMTGMAKCVLMTVVYCHPQLADQLEEHIKNLGKAELALGIAAGVIGLISVARLFQVANKVIGGATRSLICTGAEVGGKQLSTVGTTLTRAMQAADDAAFAAKNPALSAAAKQALTASAKNSMECAQQLVRNIGEEVAKETNQQLFNSLRTILGKRLPASTKVFDAFNKAFSNSAVQSMTENAIWQAARGTRRMGAEAIEREFVSVFNKKLAFAVARATLSFSALIESPVTVAKAASTGAGEIISGGLRKDAGERQEKIQKLLLQMMIMQSVVDDVERAVRGKQKEIEKDVRQHGEVGKKITGMLQEQHDILLDMAGAQA